MAICPFISNDAVTTDCLESGCQVWDDENSKCGALATPHLQRIEVKLDDLLTTQNIGSDNTASLLHDIKAINTDIRAINTDIRAINTDIKESVHDEDKSEKLIHSALNIREHTKDIDYRITVMEQIFEKTQTGPFILLQEFLGAQDLDNNGLIFGKDFYITGEVPPVLKSIESHPDFSKSGTSMTYDEYISSIGGVVIFDPDVGQWIMSDKSSIDTTL